MIIGIDPGITGAIAIAGEEGIRVHDMPSSAKITGKGNQVDCYGLASILGELEVTPDVDVYVEDVHAMPGQGVTSVFSFGRSAGVIEGVIASFGYRISKVTPQKWKKKFGLTGKDKDAARTYALGQFPELRDQLSRKKDIGRADALLIMLYGSIHLQTQLPGRPWWTDNVS